MDTLSILCIGWGIAPREKVNWGPEFTHYVRRRKILYSKPSEQVKEEKARERARELEKKATALENPQSSQGDSPTSSGLSPLPLGYAGLREKTEEAERAAQNPVHAAEMRAIGQKPYGPCDK